MDIVIKDIVPEDVDEIVQLGLATPELHVQDKEPIYYDSDTLQSFINSPNDIYLVAKIGGEIAGYRLATYNPFLKEAYLIDMVVKPKFRNKGVANALYKKTFEILNEKGCAWIWTLAKDRNLSIQKILNKKGFIKGSKFSFYYKTQPF